MPASPSYLPPLPLDNPLRQALMASLTHEHRPELADLLASADLFLEGRGLWVRPAAGFSGVSPAWLASHLQTAACEAGLALDWIQILAGPQGGEA